MVNNYKFKIKPMKHQVEEFKHHLRHRNSATFSETGAGKTLPVLTATEFRFQNNLIYNCLYVAPNSILKKIKSEILNVTDLSSLVLQHYDRKKRIKLIKEKAQIHIINYEALNIFEEYLAKNKYNCVILDEAHNIRNYKSKTSKSAFRISKCAKFKIAITGTPICSTPEDIFGIYKFLDPCIFGTKVTKFRDEWCHVVEQSFMQHGKLKEFSQVIGIKPGKEKEFKEKANSLSVRHTKKECIDLPDKVEEHRNIQLTTKLKKYYKDNKNGELKSDDGILASSDVAVVKIGLATQVSSGFFYYKENPDSKRKVCTIGTSNKLKELKEIIRLRQDKKTVVWCKYSESISTIKKQFKDLNPVVQSSRSDNDLSRKTFQTDDNCKMIINQMNICDGYDLTVSDCAIYYELPYEYHVLKQSQDRIHRKGSEIHNQIMYYYLITENTAEESILNILNRKRNLSDIVIGDFDKVISGTYTGE